MKVDHFQIETTQTHVTFSADVILEGLSYISWFKKKKQTVWYKIPREYACEETWTDAFFIVAVVVALAAKEKRLIFKESVSPEVLQKVPAIEKMFRYEHEKREIKIQTKPGGHVRKTYHETAQFFTLGVDSFFTLLCHRPNQKRALLFVDGYDIPLAKTTFLQKVHTHIDAVAKHVQMPALYISSNVRELSDPIINWPQFHVAGLVAVGMLMKFGKVLINGESFDWPDWGLRFGVDELFTTKKIGFEFIGHNMTRDVKIKKLMKSSKFDFFLQHVRVCWKNILKENVPYNCSECQKCIRTYLTFLALGIPETPTFKKPTLQQIRNLEIVGHVRYEWTVLYEMLKKRKDTDPKLIAAIADLLLKPTRV